MQSGFFYCSEVVLAKAEYMPKQGVQQASVPSLLWFHQATLHTKRVMQGSKALASATSMDGTIQAPMSWFIARAEAGDTEVQYRLGLLYQNGYGSAVQSYHEAKMWHMRAAGAKHAGAQFNLGLLYQQGLGVAKDYGQAGRWYAKAATQNHTEAQFKLGSLYQQGLGVAQDDIQAWDCYKKAARQGHIEAQNVLAALPRRQAFSLFI